MQVAGAAAIVVADAGGRVVVVVAGVVVVVVVVVAVVVVEGEVVDVVDVADGLDEHALSTTDAAATDRPPATALHLELTGSSSGAGS